MTIRQLALVACAAFVLGGCGGSGGVPGTGGNGAAGRAGTGGVHGAGGVPVPGMACGAPLSAPTQYQTQDELGALVVGSWALCDSPGLFTPEAVGIEFREDRIWVELFDVDGFVVPSQRERTWGFYDGGTTISVSPDESSQGMFLYRPVFFEAEGQMQIEHVGADRRLQSIETPPPFDGIGVACGPALSAPTLYASEQALASLVVGAWQLCAGPGLRTPEAVGIEFRDDRSWVELFAVDGEIVRSQNARSWVILEDETSTLTVALVEGSSMRLYRPKFFEPEGQMQIGDQRLQAVTLP